MDFGNRRWIYNACFLKKTLSRTLSLPEMGLQAVSRSQSSSTLTGRQCWSAVSGWLHCALTVVEVASTGLTYSIRCSAGWECSRRKTRWMPSGSWAAICVQHTVKIHQCQHTAAHADTHVLHLLNHTADLDIPRSDFNETQWYSACEKVQQVSDHLTFCLVSCSILMQEPYIDKTRIGAFGQVNACGILQLLLLQTR